MRKEIVFNDAGSAPIIPTMSTAAAAPRWRDTTVIAEGSKLRFRWPVGKTLIRLFPFVTGAEDKSYIHLINVVKNDAFKAIATPGDLFSRAYSWMWANQKDDLYHYEKNKGGIKLKPATEGLAWAAYWDEENKPHLGLIQTAFSAGKNPGLLADIVAAAEAKEINPATGEEDRVYEASIVDPVRGRLITIEKVVDKTVEARYGTSYKATISSKENAPLEAIASTLPAEEMAILRPLEQLTHKPTEEEQRELLKGYLGSTLFAKMGL
jgi:hypothetical protein